LAQRLSDRFALLVSPRTDLDRRHRSLRATVEWSFQQLEPGERDLFAGLSVFRGGWTLAAAEAVCGDLAPAMLPALAGLQRRSMVHLDETQAEPRFRMLETLRDYAAHQLPPDLAVELRRRHALHFAELAEQAEPELVGPDQTAWIDRLQRERDNLRAALEWCLQPEADLEIGLRTAAALVRFLEIRQRLREAEALLKPLLARSAEASPAARARLFEAAGTFALNCDSAEWGGELLTEALRLYQELADSFGVARAQVSLGIAHRERDDYAAARALFEEALPVLEATGHSYEVARVAGALGVLERLERRNAEGRAWLERAGALFRVCGHKRRVAWCYYQLGRVAMSERRTPLAEALFRDALATFLDVGDPIWIIYCYLDLTLMAQLDSDFPRALEHCARAVAESRRLGAEHWVLGLTLLEGDLHREAGDLAAARRSFASVVRRALAADFTALAAAGLDRLAAALPDQPETALTLLGASEALPDGWAALPGGRRMPPVADAELLAGALPPEAARTARFQGRQLSPGAILALLPTAEPADEPG
jgi:tetratricopeptide (TPR) repeat protein